MKNSIIDDINNAEQKAEILLKNATNNKIQCLKTTKENNKQQIKNIEANLKTKIQEAINQAIEDTKQFQEEKNDDYNNLVNKLKHISKQNYTDLYKYFKEKLLE